MRPNYLSLDLDNTMYDYATSHRGAIHAATLEIGDRYSMPRETVTRLIHEARAEIKLRLGNVGASHSRLLYFKVVLEKLGVPNHLDFALQLEAIYWGNFLRAMRRASGLTELLEYSREKSIPVVIMTDLTAQIQIRKLASLGALDYIAGMICSEETGQDKPHGNFLEYAESNLKVKPGHWWVIGDDRLKDGGLAESFPSVEFFHVKKNSEGLPSLNAVLNNLVKS